MAGEERKALGIEKFDGNNFGYWRMQIKDYLYGKKLHLPLLGEKPEMMFDRHWTHLDRQVLGVIRLTMSRSVAHNIIKKKTTTNLMKAFSGKGKLKYDDIRDLILSKRFVGEMQKKYKMLYFFQSTTPIDILGSWTQEPHFIQLHTKRLFKTYVVGNFGKVYLADDETLDVVGIREIHIKMPIGSTWKIYKVQHIPSLKRNLISIGQLDEEGDVILFIGGIWKITKGAIVVARGRNIDNLYMTLSPRERLIVVDAGNDTSLWHRRLGLMSEKGMKVLSSKGKLPQLKSVKFDLCESCILGKQRKSQGSTYRFNNLRVKIMANTPRPQMLEGQSTHRPPLFIGSDYGYWKNRMIMYIKGQDYHVWRIIANGPHIPTKTVEGATLAKLESEWNEADVRLIELNCKAMSTLYCALDPIEYNRVSGCDSAKEIWDKLEVTYEGTNQVKESKMNMLVHEYELFVMKKDENISEMSTRSLPKRWEAKMTAISEARDLKVLTLEELFGSLMTYELEMNSKVEEEEVKPKKNFALKSSHHDHDNSEEERDEEEEIALMTRNFKKFLKKKKGFGRRFPKKGENKGESSKTETPTCYKCKKQGHYKNECPQDNNSSDNEVANLCLLGYINESNISEDEHASFCPLAFNDDESATEDLCLMAHGDEVCLISKSIKDKWFLDSGCSRHMTGDKNKFTSLTLKDGGNVKFGDNSKGKIIGIASSSNQVDSSEKVKDQVDEPKDEEKALPPTNNEELPKSWNVVHSHPKELIIGEIEHGVSTRSKLKDICNNMAFLSQIEPKNINEAIEDESWILAMQEELNQFERNKVWTLAPRPKDHSVIGTKWVFRNKKDEEGIIVRNKARLVAQGYNQEEGFYTWKT
uniref:CCHC-type domain-containing protein n=1 Tax=Fagus sylvatica TaxID=28930 RepID=A0A2N9GGP6_FAGSY